MNTHQHKVEIYKQLISDIEDNRYEVMYNPVGIGI